jgi:NAD-dependent dihydropyrimidine dehydrogenase PreA subunit
MCEFCVSHGEGKKWYQNMTNYSRELFLQVNSDTRLQRYLAGFASAMREGEARAAKYQQRFPRLYRWLAYPWLSHRQKKSHFGQIVPLEDLETILARTAHVVRLPCICRKVTTGREQRVCYGVGMEAGHILQEVPDFADFDRISPATAAAEIGALDRQGLTHSVWTFQTPFIGAICNCDRDCMAYRIQYREELAQVMWRGEYVARIDPDRCRGCRECLARCLFGAIRYDPDNDKCRTIPERCYGCGVCRPTCPHGAIGLLDRRDLPETVNLW